MAISGSKGSDSIIHFEAVPGGTRFHVWVQPRASRTELAGSRDGALRVRIAAPPVDGAANAELVRFLARRLRVPRGNIAIVAGEGSRSKRVVVEGLSPDATARRLL